MYTLQALNQARSMKAIASHASQLIRKPLIKVDKGNRVSIRDKAIRNIMPKAMDCMDRKISKTLLMNRVLDMIEKAQKMGKGKADNLVAQLWVVYAHIETHHRQDEHWQLSDIPQMKNMPKLTDRWYIDDNGKVKAKPDTRELVMQNNTPYWTGDECNKTRGNHFYKVDSPMTDNPDQCWSLAELLNTDNTWLDVAK